MKKETAPTLDGLTAAEWSDKGGGLAQLGRNQEALQCIDKALEIGPRYANAWALKGTVLDILRRPQEALPCYDKALEINPKHAGTWAMKGGVLYELGRHQEALQCIDKALEINPKHADAWAKKGAVLHELGRRQDAIQCIDKGLEIDPQNARAQQAKRIISASKLTCDICGGNVSEAEIRRVFPSSIARATNQGFVPTGMPVPPGFSKSTAWKGCVAQYSSAPWGICNWCNNELVAFWLNRGGAYG